MPPKPQLSTDRLRKELEAQRARAAALNHLASTGSGPSQNELAKQHQQRATLVNATSRAVQKHLGIPSSGAASSSSSSSSWIDDSSSMSMRDNTLQAMAQRRARELHIKQQLLQQTSSLRSGELLKNPAESVLPSEWQQVVDPNTGDKYYWNKNTNETSWTPPQLQQSSDNQKSANQLHEANESADGQTAQTEEMPKGWEQVQDPQSGSVYYWNKLTNETSWSRPVSIAQAVQAKSKLDAILAKCGGGDPASSITVKQTTITGTRASTKPLSSRSASSPADKPPAKESVSVGQVHAGTSHSIEKESDGPKPVPLVLKRKPADKVTTAAHQERHQQAQPPLKKAKKTLKPEEIDPLDPTGGRGKWSDGLFSQGERAADTTANGPLFQQRPYPAPGQILRKETRRK